MKKIRPLLLVLLGSLQLSAQPSASTIYFVTPTGNDANNGQSWATAFRTLQRALQQATSGYAIWVAAGTYYPDEGGGTTNNSRESAFTLKSGVEIYGGFGGTEATLSQRAWAAHETILSGEIQQNGDNADNAYHVVRATGGISATTVLDGFTIKGGRADGYTGGAGNGGGLYNYASSPTVANCTFVQNYASYGGAVYNDQGSSPSLTNCSFTQNTAGANGGGLLNDNASAPVLTTCRFSDNKAHQGGALYNNHASSPLITNCSFTRNSAQADGGGVYNYNASAPTLINGSFWQNTADHGGVLYNFSSSPVLINCSLYGNTATAGGALAGQEAYPTLTNCILWGNSSALYEIAGYSTVSYSIIQGGHDGTANLDADPLFRNAAGGDLRLQYSSPAKDAGDNAVVSVATDADGKPRIQYNRVDKGAYEFQPGDPGSTVYVHPDGDDANNGATWATALRTVQKALARASGGSQVWVAKGTYYPDEIDSTNSNSTAASFVLRSGVALYGGFAGTEMTLEERNWALYETILSGDINQDGGFGGNSNNVVKGVSNSVLDGFTITAGSASSTSFPYEGGGGMHNQGSPTVRNCIFRGNQAYGYYSYGGAVLNDGAYPTFINCLFWNNAGSIGGAIFNFLCNSPANIINCTFAYNGGGAIFNQQASPNITNCILWGNSGFQIANMPNFPSNPSVMSSIVQGGWSGIGNLSADPLFVNAATGDLRIMAGSPAIDAGYNGAITGITHDLSAHKRIVGAAVDMGAYEHVSTQGEPPDSTYPLTLTCPGDFTVTAEAGSCGAQVNYFESHPALIMGGKGPVTVTYTPASGSVLPVGENTITVTATDAADTTRSCSFTVTVVDSTPPVITPPFPGVDAFGAHTDADICAYTVPGDRLDIAATDNCPGPLAYFYSLSGATTGGLVEGSTLSGVKLHKGETIIHYLVRDAAGNEATYELKVFIEDRSLPRITNVSVDKPVLYPPNHKLQDVTVSYTATDNCEVASTALSVSSNEATNTPGSGNTSPDWQVIDAHHLRLRAERSGRDSDRIYTITIIAKDAAGNLRATRTTVTIPHDKGAPVTAAEAAAGKEVASLSINAVPNPSSDGFTLTVQSPSDLPLSIKVIDPIGKVIDRKEGLAPNGTFYLGSTYRPGVYYLQVQQGSARQTLKLVKQTH